jgi:hypothetical protein
VSVPQLAKDHAEAGPLAREGWVGRNWTRGHRGRWFLGHSAPWARRATPTVNYLASEGQTLAETISDGDPGRARSGLVGEVWDVGHGTLLSGIECTRRLVEPLADAEI